MSLTPEEEGTIKAYDKLISERVSQGYFNPEFWRPEFEAFQKILPSGRVLDVGCGTGRDAHLFLEAGYGYVGIDLSSVSLEIARKQNPGAVFQRMDMYAMEFPDNVFDGFWAAASLLHAPGDRVRLLLDEVARASKPGGLGLIVMQEGDGPQMVGERFFNFTSLEAFRDVLEHSQFQVLDAYKDSENPDRLGPTSGDDWLVYVVQNRGL